MFPLPLAHDVPFAFRQVVVPHQVQQPVDQIQDDFVLRTPTEPARRLPGHFGADNHFPFEPLAAAAPRNG